MAKYPTPETGPKHSWPTLRGWHGWGLSYAPPGAWSGLVTWIWGNAPVSVSGICHAPSLFHGRPLVRISLHFFCFLDALLIIGVSSQWVRLVVFHCGPTILQTICQLYYVFAMLLRLFVEGRIHFL